MKRVATIGLAIAAVLAPAAQAGKSADMDDYIPGAAKLQAFYAASALGDKVLFGPADATTVYVDGRWTRDACERVKLGAYLCPMNVYYRLEPGQHFREHCEAPVVVRRTGYRFPPARTTCPDGWLPPPAGRGQITDSKPLDQ